MQHQPRSFTHDAHLEAARRFGERAKASAQWRRGEQRVEVSRGGARPGSGAEPRSTPVGGGKRGDARSHA